MSPPHPLKQVARINEESRIIKTSKIGKVKTEIRKKIPSVSVNTMNTTTVKRKYILNRKNQINKLVMKNKLSSPTTVEYNTSSVVLRYSPPVFKEAVEVALNDMNEGDEYKTNNLVIQVKKIRKAEEKTNIIVDKLITLEVQSKMTTVKPISQQIHVYNTTQSIMVQGSRLIKETKGFKVLVEDFLQPHIEYFVKEKEVEIKATKDMIDNIKKSEENKEEKRKLVHQCDKCSVKFKSENDLINHKDKMHLVPDERVECSQIISDIIQGITVKDNTNTTQEINIIQPKDSKIAEKLSLIIKEIKNPSITLADKIEFVEDKSANLKRVNSMSPKGSQGKNLKITLSPPIQQIKVMKQGNDNSNKLKELEEDLKLVKEERYSLKLDHTKLLADKIILSRENYQIKIENTNLKKKLVEQEEEVVQAMQEIAEEVAEERKKFTATSEGESFNQKDFQKKTKEDEKKYNQLKDEKDKIMEDLVIIQKEKDLMSEKLESIEKETKIQKNLKLFDCLVGETDKKDEDVDECIRTATCAGDCDDVSEAVNLINMKNSGGRRSCPQTTPKIIFKCNNCDFVTGNKILLSKHVEKTHQKKLLNNNTSTDQTRVKRPCAYYNSPKGCKKGDTCDWDHSDDAQAQFVTKVSILCRYKEACQWKPRCRFIHPEDGESVGFPNNQSRDSASGSPAQDFVRPDMGSHPPGWNQIPPPAKQNPEYLIQQIQQQMQQINLMCLTAFPNLMKKQGQ